MQKENLKQLKSWFISQRRDLPWRENPTPYAVWISEVMLQQTQVAVVIPYFERWMKLFPTIRDLANAPIDLVLKTWEGLGYYARARHLHAGAAYVVAHYEGELPSSEAALKKIKGLGDYTVGAILGFGFHQRKAAVDGNVVRVLARYYAFEEDIGKSKSIKKIQEMAEKFLPEEEPWVISEALIELGAIVCARTPRCQQCPLKSHCQAFLHGNTDKFPIKSARAKTEHLYRSVAVIEAENSLLVKKGIKGKVMEGLYEFPYFDRCSSEDLKRRLLDELQLEADWKSSLNAVKHSFTRYCAHLFPDFFAAPKRAPVPGHEWIPFHQIHGYPFSSGHRRILIDLFESGSLPHKA